MSDSSSDTSVGSSPYESDKEVMKYVIVGEYMDTDKAPRPAPERHCGKEGESQTPRSTQTMAEPAHDDVVCPTPERQVGNDSEQQVSGATHGMTEPQHGSLQEENIRLRKRIEELELFFDRISLTTVDSGYSSDRSSLSSLNSVGAKMKVDLTKVYKQKKNVARPTFLRPGIYDEEHDTSQAAQSLATPVIQHPPREDTDIHAACKEGDLNRFRRILSANLLTDNKTNILHVACIGGHVNMVKYVLSLKVVDINRRGQYGRTPVMLAAEMGHREVFHLLVREGADISLVDDKRNNILFLACIGGHSDIVKYVLSLKVVDINRRGQYGRTPVMVAAEMGHREVFDLLVREGADISLVDDKRDNILHMACIGGHSDMVKYVLSLKVVDINRRDRYGRTPVMVAAGKGHREVFDLLVREGADISLVDDKRNNILFLACIGGHSDIVKYVLSLKVVDINRRGQYGRTPVMVAAEKGHREVFDLLVREGADISLVDDDGDNILYVACIGGHSDIVKYVLSSKVVDINRRGQYGRTPVMLAAGMGHNEMFDLLVRGGADVSLVDDDGDNILYVACIAGHSDMVKNVLSLKVVDINSRGQYGWTPVMLAAEMGHKEVFDILVREGADLSGC